MKLAFTVAFIVSTVSAFSPNSLLGRSSTRLSMVDTEAAIEEAMEASEKFGKTSPEARAAWDIVEELNASNSHHSAGDIHVAAPTEEAAPSEPAVVDDAEDYSHMSAKIDQAKKNLNALEEAKRITEEKGINSPEARLAWETVEELAATSTHHKVTGSG